MKVHTKNYLLIKGWFEVIISKYLQDKRAIQITITVRAETDDHEMSFDPGPQNMF